jgi:hypothetical protein
MVQKMGKVSISDALAVFAPLMTPTAFCLAIGLEEGVFRAQFDRGYWGAPIRIGKRVFVNVEAVRIKCAERAAEFSL